MKLQDIIDCFITWGNTVRTSDLYAFNRYMKDMFKRNRVILVSGKGRIEAVICYFLTDNANLPKFDNKPLWSTPYDSNDGDIIFIDKMVASKWNRRLRMTIHDAIQEKYPFVEQVIWLREPKNRHVIINMKGNHVYS